MARISRRIRIVLISTVSALAVAGGVTAIASYIYQDDQRTRANAVVEFRQDLVNAGFAVSMDDASLQVGWKEEPEQTCDDGGFNCRTKMDEEIDASAVIGNCPVELERDYPAAMAPEEIRGGVTVVKFYKFDEVNVGDSPDGIDVTVPGRDRPPYRTSHPTRDQVYDYLAANHKSFPCFVAEQPR